MERIILIFLLTISSFTFSQNGEGKHFWACAGITATVHITIGTKEKAGSIGAGLFAGIMKEIFDSTMGKNISASDLWHDTTGSIFGFIVSDIYKRNKNNKLI